MKRKVRGEYARRTPIPLHQLPILRHLRHAGDRDPVRAALVVEAEVHLGVVVDFVELLRGVVGEEVEG